MLLRVENAVVPMAWVVFGIGALSIMDAVIKALSATVPLGQIVVLRYVFGALAAFPIYLAARPRVTWASLRANGFRAIVIALTAGGFFHALWALPLAEALALSFLSPVFLALFGALLLGEPISRRIVGAIALGFIGVLIILSAKFSGFEALDSRTMSGVAAALFSAVSYAFAMVLLRRQSASDSPAMLVFPQSLLAAAVASPALAFGTTALDGVHLMLFAVAGLLGAIGHFALAWGYARVEAARLGPLEYTSFLWAAAIGYAVFDEPLATETLFGAGLIMAACLLAARRANAS